MIVMLYNLKVSLALPDSCCLILNFSKNQSSQSYETSMNMFFTQVHDNCEFYTTLV